MKAITPTFASSFTSSPVAGGFAGGTPLQQAPFNLNSAFPGHNPHALHQPGIGPMPTHMKSFASAGPPPHTVHDTRFSG